MRRDRLSARYRTYTCSVPPLRMQEHHGSEYAKRPLTPGPTKQAILDETEVWWANSAYTAAPISTGRAAAVFGGTKIREREHRRPESGRKIKQALCCKSRSFYALARPRIEASLYRQLSHSPSCVFQSSTVVGPDPAWHHLAHRYRDDCARARQILGGR